LKVAVQWTGGKTSSLACYKAIKQGHQVAYIVTFLTEKTPSIHTLDLIKLQSEALGIPLLWDKLAPPYREAYRESILTLKKDHGIKALVTADTPYTDSLHREWIYEACKDAAVKVLNPLWELGQSEIIQELFNQRFQTCLDQSKAPSLMKAG